PRARPSALARRLRSTLGPANRDCVNTAATFAGTSEITTKKSSSGSLMPMFPATPRKPAGTGVWLFIVLLGFGRHQPTGTGHTGLITAVTSKGYVLFERHGRCDNTGVTGYRRVRIRCAHPGGGVCCVMVTGLRRREHASGKF